MKRPLVAVVFRDLPKPANRWIVPSFAGFWSLERRVEVAHQVASGFIGRPARAYVEIIDQTARDRWSVSAEAAARWAGTHTSATSTPSSGAGWIAGRELGGDF